MESTPNVGSTFYFTAMFGCEKKARQTRTALPKRLRQIKVLVVDDNETARLLLRNLLHGFGVLPTLVTSGDQALAVLGAALSKGAPFDLVFMDQRMRSMDGIETVERLRHFAHPPPKVIMLTAFSKEEILDRSGAAGVDMILQKPIGRIPLFNAILEVFGEQKGKITDVERSVHEKTAHLSGRIGGARVLVVEDNPINQQVIGEILEHIGLEVVLARDGVEAIQKLSQSVFDIILMDIQMPIMDGVEATRRIRLQPAWETIPILAMTANAMVGDREKYLEAGMVDHLTKPIDKKALYAALLRWISPREGLGKVTLTSEPIQKKMAPWVINHLPGICLVEVLERLNGNHPLLRVLLKEFLRDFAQAEQKIALLLQGEEPEGRIEAGRLVHTIRGMAGNLSAQRLFEAAGRLEIAIKEEGAAGWESPMTAFVAALREVVQGIASLPTAAEEERNTVKSSALLFSDPTAVLPLLTEWATWIQEGNLKALQRETLLRPVLRQAGVEGRLLDGMREALDRMDFEEANRAVSSIIKMFE